MSIPAVQVHHRLNDRRESFETMLTVELSDEERMRRAKEYMLEDKVLAAARCLERIPETARTGQDAAFCRDVLQKAELLRKLIIETTELPPPPQKTGKKKFWGFHKNGLSANSHDSEDEPGITTRPSTNKQWIKLGTTHNKKHDVLMHYRWLSKEYLQCRFESPIEPSLLVPLVAVLNESSLYTTWLPKWQTPKLGVHQVHKLAQLGRTEQLVHLLAQMPPPMMPIDVMVQSFASDDINDNSQDPEASGTIGIKFVSLDEGEKVSRQRSTSTSSTTSSNDNSSNQPKQNRETANAKDDDEEFIRTPVPPKGFERAYFDGGMVIRKCPPDHPVLKKSKLNRHHKDGNESQLLLVGFTFTIDAEIGPFFPAFVLEFLLRHVFRSSWVSFLQVAEQIRDGKRPKHAQAIDEKRDELYGWVERRMTCMLRHLDD